MKFSYEDLISGDAIPVDGVGHICSPRLEMLKPTLGIGTWKYNLYLNLLSWDKEELMKFMRLSTGKKLKSLDNADKLEAFDIISLIDAPRALLQEAMAFFMVENIVWDDKKRVFQTINKQNGEIIGCIDRENFEDVRDMMLQVNYISVGKKAKPEKFASKKAQEYGKRRKCI